MKFAPIWPARSAPSRVSRRASSRVAGFGEVEPAPSEARVEVEARADAVDAVPVEGVANLVQVLGGELGRVVELVVVDQVARGPATAGRTRCRGRLVAVLRLLVADRHEPRHRRAERPDPEARSRRASVWFRRRRGRRVGASRTRDEHRAEQHEAGDHELRAGRQPHEVHAVLDRCDDERRPRRGRRPAGLAEEARARDTAAAMTRRRRLSAAVFVATERRRDAEDDPADARHEPRA